MINSAIAYYFRGNSKLVIFAFFVTVFFNVTAYKFIWSLEQPSRVFNILALLLFTLYSINVFINFQFNRKIIFLYIIPGILVYTGFLFNLSISSSQNFIILRQFGSLIPWAIYLAIPGLLKSHRINVFSLWSCFDNFLFATVSLSLVEYFLIFSGYITPRPIITSGGNFVASLFSILYELKDCPISCQLHYRFYASFLEPGTLAMFLLPFIAYTFLHSKFFRLSIYLFALYLTDSLGGFIGFAILLPLLIYLRFRKNLFSALAFSILTIFLFFSFSFNEFLHRYEQKGFSATVREENAVGFINLFPQLVVRYPFGLPIKESTEQAMNLELYPGTNNSLGLVYASGGIISFVGFLTILCVSLWYAIASLFRIGSSIDEQAAAASVLCLFTFIIQRQSIWETPIFSLLYAPFVIYFLRNETVINKFSGGEGGGEGDF